MRFILIICLALMGCSFVTRNHIAPKPMEKGQSQAQLSLIIPFSQINYASFHMTIHAGLTDDVTLSYNIPNFIILGSIGVARYAELDHGYANTHLMINDLGGTSWNPMTQIGTGVYSKNMYGSLSAGYFTPDLFTLALDSYTKDDFGFDIQAYASGEYYGKTLFIQYSSEMTNRYIKKSKGNYQFSEQTIEVKDFKGFSESQNGLIIQREHHDNLVLSYRTPYVDCMGCGIKYLRFNKFSFSQPVYLAKTTRDSINNIESYRDFELESARLYDIDLNKIKSDILSTNSFTLPSSEENTRLGLESKTVWNDFTVGFGVNEQ